MDSATHIVPFTLPQSETILSESSGLLKLEGRNLIMEYQTRDAVLGMLKSSVKEITFSLGDVQKLAFSKGFFSSKIVIQSKLMRTFEKVPGSAQGNVELKIQRSDRQAAEYLISAANLRMSEMKIEALDDTDDLLG